MTAQTELTPDGPANIIETDYTIGQDNIQPRLGPFGLDIHNPVFMISGLTIVAFVFFALALPEQAGAFFGWLRPAVTSTFDWFFLGAGNIFVLVALALVVTPLGKVRLGGMNAKPDYSYAGWVAMLFAAGMGIGLMFFGVPEPISHFSSSVAEGAGAPESWAPLAGAAGDETEARRLGMAATIFHWGLHPWAIYAIVGLSLALFAYNKGLPLTIRSAFYPIFGERVWGWTGHVIDTLAVFATLFGLATSLGFGAERGRQPEQRREHGQRVDDVACPAPDLLAEDRIEDRAHAERQPLIVGEQRQGQADNGVDRPGVQAPVEDRGGHAEPPGLGLVAGRAGQRRPAFRRAGAFGQGRIEVRDRLGHAEEHQSDAHAGGEQHGEPAGIGIVRLGIHAAEADTAKRRDHQRQGDQHEDVAGGQEEPVEGRGHRRAQPAEELAGLFRQGEGEEDEGDDRQSGDQEDRVMDIQAEGPDRRLDVVLAERVIGVDHIRRSVRREFGLRSH